MKTDKPTSTEIASSLGVTKRHARRLANESKLTAGALNDKERYEKARADAKELEAKEKKISLALVEGDLVSKKANADSLREILEQVKAQMFFECGEQLAVLNAGLSAEKQMHNNRAAVTRALRSLDDWAAKKLEKC